jgi:hypothetical protein
MIDENSKLTAIFAGRVGRLNILVYLSMGVI